MKASGSRNDLCLGVLCISEDKNGDFPEWGEELGFEKRKQGVKDDPQLQGVGGGWRVGCSILSMSESNCNVYE